MNRPNVKENYLLRRISPKESYQDLLNFPRYIEIETVNACNAKCPMCTIGDWQREAPSMQDDLFMKIANELSQHANVIKRVSLYRDGEPLIDKKLAERVRILKEKKIQNTAISTNVSLLNAKRSKDLLEAGLDLIILSIDSLKKEIFESIRAGLKFEEVLKNALQFIDLRNKMKSQTKIWVRMIRQESNQFEWDSYHSYWKAKLSDEDRVYYHNIFNWGGQLKDFKPISSSYEPNLPCVALWSLLVIFSNGDVPLCNVDYNNKYPTGSILNHTIAELWQSKIMNERRAHHLKGEKANISLCQNCNVWDESPDSHQISSEFASSVELKMD